MEGTFKLEAIDTGTAPTVTDMVFRALYERIVSLELPPHARLSEAEVARQLDVSRQPVRDAFFRLSTLGLLRIRPQRATTVAPIEPAAVEEARFLRTAIEVQCIRLAATGLPRSDLAELDKLLDDQDRLVQQRRKAEFHALDDRFHSRLFEMVDKGFAWTIVRERKGHMDRVRYISLEFGAQEAVDDHRAILGAIRDGDPDAAEQRMTTHLGRIEGVLAAAIGRNPDIFGAAR